jgi:hypothetical protein
LTQDRRRRNVAGMDTHGFRNRIRSLSNIDGDQILELSLGERYAFVRDPVRFFLRASDEVADAIFREVERRQTRTPNPSAAVSAQSEDRTND